jgi:Rod binding domain-containing protein
MFRTIRQNKKTIKTENPMTTIPILPPPQSTARLPDYIQSDEKMRDAAQQLEATFLAEMLKSAGVGAPRDSFGGGVGEEQFASFLREAQAEEMVKAGGIGLAEALFEAMKVRVHA